MPPQPHPPYLTLNTKPTTIILTPYPNLEQCVAELPIHWVYILNRNIGYELSARLEYSAFGPMWKYHAFHLARYALLLMERAETTPINPANYWWARVWMPTNPNTGKPFFSHPENRQWQHPASFFKRFMARDTGYPEWWGDTTIHHSHQTYLKTKDHKDLVFPYINLQERLQRINGK